MIPLSTRMRPESLDEFVGQDHFMYKGSLFYNAIKNKTFDSIFYRSGTGKTPYQVDCRKWIQIFGAQRINHRNQKSSKMFWNRQKPVFYQRERPIFM